MLFYANRTLHSGSMSCIVHQRNIQTENNNSKLVLNFPMFECLFCKRHMGRNSKSTILQSFNTKRAYIGGQFAVLLNKKRLRTLKDGGVHKSVKTTLNAYSILGVFESEDNHLKIKFKWTAKI